MDDWNPEWLLEKASLILDNNTEQELENVNSPNVSRDSVDSTEDEINSRHSVTLPAPFKSVTHAKKRLHAYSILKKLKKSGKEEKHLAGCKSVIGSHKKLKKALYPDEKAKAVIEEIEEIKRNEAKYEAVKQEMLAVSIKKYSTSRGKSQSKSPGSQKRFKKREIRSRNYRRTVITSRKSGSPEDSNRKTDRTSKHIYPKNWSEYNQQDLTVKKDNELKLQMFPSHKLPLSELFSTIYSFATPSPILEPFLFCTTDDIMKEIPVHCIRYTKSKPVIPYSVNFKHIKENFLTRNQLYSLISKDRRHHIEKLINSQPRASSSQQLEERFWYSKYWKKSVGAECKVLENSVGLSFLQSYSDEENEEHDADEVVICSSTKKNKASNKMINSIDKRIKQEQFNDMFILNDFKENTKKIISPLNLDKLSAFTKLEYKEKSDLESERIDQEGGTPVVEVKEGNLTPDLLLEPKHPKYSADHVTQTKKAIKELEQEIKRRQSTALNDSKKGKTKCKKNKKTAEESSDTEGVDLKKLRKKQKLKARSKAKKNVSYIEDASGSEDRKKKKKKKDKLKKDKNMKKKVKIDKIRTKDECLSDTEEKDDRKKKRKSQSQNDILSEENSLNLSLPNKIKNKTKKNKRKSFEKTEVPEDNKCQDVTKKMPNELKRELHIIDKIYPENETFITEKCEDFKVIKISNDIIPVDNLYNYAKTPEKGLDEVIMDIKKFDKFKNETSKPTTATDESDVERRESNVNVKSFEIELKIDRKFLDRKTNLEIKKYDEFQFKPITSVDKTVVKTEFEDTSLKSQTDIKNIIPDEFEDFPLEKDILDNTDEENNIPYKKFKTPDDECRESWEKDSLPIWESEDDLPSKPKLNRSWESDEEIFERGHSKPVERSYSHNINFALEIPLNIKPFKPRQLDTDTELEYLQIQNQSYDEKKPLEFEESNVKNSKLFKGADKNDQKPIYLVKSVFDEFQISPEVSKKGRWDKKVTIPRISTPHIVVDENKIKEEKIKNMTATNSTTAVLENEYEEFMKAVTLNSTNTVHDTDKLEKRSSSNISDVESNCFAANKEASTNKDVVYISSGCSSTTESVQMHIISPKDIPFIPMPAELTPVPVPSPQVNMENMPQPFVALTSNVPINLEPITDDSVPKLDINLTTKNHLDLDTTANDSYANKFFAGQSNTTYEVCSSTNHSQPGIQVFNTTDLDFALNDEHIKYSTNELAEIATVIPSVTYFPEVINSLDAPFVQQSRDAILNSPYINEFNIHNIDNSSQLDISIKSDKPFTFSGMVLPTKKMLLDNSKLNLDDSDDEDKLRSLTKLDHNKNDSEETKLYTEEEKVKSLMEPSPNLIRDNLKNQPLVETQCGLDKKEKGRSKSPQVKITNTKNEKSAPKKPSNRRSSSPRTKHRNSPSRKRVTSPRRSPHRKKSIADSRRYSQKRSPNYRRKSDASFRRRSISPKRGRKRSRSPRKRSITPRRRSISPRRYNVTQRRRSISPRRRSISPRRRSISPRRKRSITPRKRSYKRSVSPKPSFKKKRSKSPEMSIITGSQIMSFINPPRRESPLPVVSSLGGLERSVADSTISDDMLLQPQVHFEEFANSPIPRYTNRLNINLDSPKRVSLDDRINQVLGVKDESKSVSTTYENYDYQNIPTRSRVERNAKNNITVNKMFDKLQNEVLAAIKNSSKSTQNEILSSDKCISIQPSHNNFVQVGNMLQIVPTDIPMRTSNLIKREPLVSESLESQDKTDNKEKSKIVQVGNVLQVVPTDIQLPQPSQSIQASLPPLEVKSETEDIPKIQIEKQSAEEFMKQKAAERRAEREKRRQEKERRRAEKDKKRKEKEKLRQIKLKQKTENMIKRALQLEVEGGAEEDDDSFLSEAPAQWPPVPQICSSKDTGRSILLRGGIGKRDLTKIDIRKVVQFADGVKPGEGTSPSGGEELTSPPPLNSLPKEKRYKKTKLLKKIQKKKVKVKVIKKPLQPILVESDEEDNLPPPSPPPGSPPPHLFPPRVKTHTVNNVHPYSSPAAVSQQLFSNTVNLIMAPPPPPPLPSSHVSSNHHIQVLSHVQQHHGTVLQNLGLPSQHHGQSQHPSQPHQHHGSRLFSHAASLPSGIHGHASHSQPPFHF